MKTVYYYAQFALIPLVFFVALVARIVAAFRFAWFDMKKDIKGHKKFYGR